MQYKNIGKPFKKGNLTLYNCDCMELLKQTPDKYYDLAITSPPYNMNLRIRNGVYCSRQIVPELSTKYENYSDNLKMEDYFKFTKETIMELIRVSKLVFWNVQLVTGNKPAIFAAVGQLAHCLKEVIIWDKCSAEPAIGIGVLNSEFEFIFVFSSIDSISRSFESTQFKRGCLSNVLRLPKNKGDNKTHKASFPIGLPKWIMSNFGTIGQKVIDPFSGMFTTAIACHYMGYELTGCELDEDYFKAGIERVKQETAQVSMF